MAKRVVHDPRKLENGHVYMLFPTLSLSLMAIGISAMEIALHFDTVFAWQNVLFLSMASIPLFAAFVTGRLHLVSEGAFHGWTWILFSIGLATAPILVMQAIIGFLIDTSLYFITNVEIFLFYINAAISEELLYRVGIVALTYVIVNWVCKQNRVKKQPANMIAMILSIMISGTAFSLSHLGVYADVPLMLLSTFIGGSILAAVLVYTKNPLACIVAHVLNNAIAAGIIIST